MITLRWFRILSFIEASSFLLLLFVAMPLKYLAGFPLAVTIVGAAHGWIFVAYLVYTVLVARKLGWKKRWVAGAYLASVLPFGPFVLDWRLTRKPFHPTLVE